MKAWRPALLIAACCLAGCASVGSSGGPEVLVAFPVEQFRDPLSGARKLYHGGGSWQAPLHTRDMVRRFAREHGLVAKDAWPIEPLGMYCVAFAAGGGIGEAELLERLNADGRVALAQPNQRFETMLVGARSYDDPLFDLQYGNFRRVLQQLHEVSLGDDVRVGVIDSSVDTEHPDLRGQIARQRQLMPVESLDDIVHGTAVAGIIAAAAGNGEGVVGLAPEAAIHVFGACNKHGSTTSCTSFTLAKALVYAMQGNMDVLNMSLAGPHDPLLAMLIGRAVEGGMIIIAADNQSGSASRFPAILPSVHSAPGDSQIWFARAEQLSTQAGGGYQVFFGSSIAAAGLTGLAALVRSVNSSEDTDAALSWLLEGCRSRSMPALAEFEPQWLCE